MLVRHEIITFCYICCKLYCKNMFANITGTNTDIIFIYSTNNSYKGINDLYYVIFFNSQRYQILMTYY